MNTLLLPVSKGKKIWHKKFFLLLEGTYGLCSRNCKEEDTKICQRFSIGGRNHFDDSSRNDTVTRTGQFATLLQDGSMARLHRHVSTEQDSQVFEARRAEHSGELFKS